VDGEILGGFITTISGFRFRYTHPGLSPTTLNVGLAQSTRELFRATSVQSISAPQTTKMNVITWNCMALLLLTAEPMDVEREYRSDFRHQQIYTGNSLRRMGT
jgi:hypothetical protein